MNRYLEWASEDSEYLLELREELRAWSNELEKKVFDGKWSRSINNVIAGIKDVIVDTVKSYEKNINEARRELDEKHNRILIKEDRRNVEGTGEEPRDFDKDVARTEQESLGIAQKEIDDNSESNQCGEVSVGDSIGLGRSETGNTNAISLFGDV